MKTPIEPYRIKAVEPLRMTTVEERRELLRRADYNVFRLRAEDVLIDLLTDSGTAAMSAGQWSALMAGDESYAGSSSYYRFERAVREVMPFEHVLPVHQGRAAERILFAVAGGEGRVIPGNTHFDTTRANAEASGARAVDLVIPEGREPSSEHPFKGNMDVARLDRFLARHRGRVPLVMLTVTNNAGGGQPVSLANIRRTKEVCRAHGVPLFLDACRFAENAYFIKRREPGYADWSIPEIARAMFALADGATMSAKKDGLANIGGWLALRDETWAEEARNLLILTEGFPTYGGLAGRDLEAIAAGLREVVDEDYLEHRVRSLAALGEALTDRGVPIVRPVGGHAIYVDARAFLPHLAPLEYPGLALVAALYAVGGVRAVEIGSVMFGRQPDGREEPAALELVRLAFPRRVYTKSHADYVVECFEEIAAMREALPGFAFDWEAPTLRHFSSRFRPLGPLPWEPPRPAADRVIRRAS